MINKESLPITVPESNFYQYLKKINKIPSLSHEEEFSLAKKYLEQGNLEAAHTLVTSHLKLVVKIALNYKSYGFPILELISEGNIGLMQAVKKYNPDLGFRLSTYAMWWIKAAIQEYILRSWSLVKIATTATQKKLFFNLSKIKNKISNIYARPINDDDYNKISEDLGINIQEVKDMSFRLSGNDISLNEPISSDKGEMIEYILENRPTQETLIINQEENFNKNVMLKQALQILNTRELEILTDRKLKEPPKTLDELSVKYSISKERVRQIENKAFEKIQSAILDGKINKHK